MIITSASFDTVIAPSSTWLMNSFTRSLPRSRAAGSRASLPSSTIWSSRLCSAVTSTGCAAVAFLTSLIGSLLGPQLALQARQLVLIGYRLAQHLFQLVVTLHAAAQIRQPVPQLQQLFQRLHLPGDGFGSKIVEALKREIDFQLGRVGTLAQLVLHRIRQMGPHAFQNGIEIIRVDLHELSILHPGQRLRRLAGEVAHYAHHKGQFLHFDGPAYLDVVGNLYTRRADAIEFMLCALFRHLYPPKNPGGLFLLSGLQGRYRLPDKGQAI